MTLIYLRNFNLLVRMRYILFLYHLMLSDCEMYIAPLVYHNFLSDILTLFGWFNS